MRKSNIVNLIPLLSAILMLTYVIADDSSSVRETILLNILHRHGDRAPQRPEMVPKDPNKPAVFDPPGLGQLTNRGKRRAYALGQTLREAYGDFLGIYTPKALDTLCTNVDRTQMTLLAMMAALYPPEGSTVWNKTLNWQPIPYRLADHHNRLLHATSCPIYKKERAKVSHSQEVHNKSERFNDLMERITHISGKKVNHVGGLYQFFNLYEAEFLFKGAKSFNLSISDVKLLAEAANLVYEINSYNDILIRQNGGILLGKMINDMKAACKGKIPRGRKAYVYSAHESHIAAMIRALGKEVVEPPFYASAIVLELVKEDSECFVKSLYYPSYEKVLKSYPIDGCDELCPIGKFEKLLESHLPTHDEIKCRESDHVASI